MKPDLEGLHKTYHVKLQWGNKSFCKAKKLRDWNIIVRQVAVAGDGERTVRAIVSLALLSDFGKSETQSRWEIKVPKKLRSKKKIEQFAWK